MKKIKKNRWKMEMKKKVKALIVCTILVSFLSSNVCSLYAVEQAGTTYVTAEISDDSDLFKFEVHVGVGGKVLKGNSVIENGSVVYQLSIDENPTFVIYPHEGYKIKSVVYEKPEQDFSQDITHLIEESKITIDTEETEMQLYITFEEKKEEIKEPIPESKSQDSINTGYQSNVISYLCLVFVSLFFILFKKKKKEN